MSPTIRSLVIPVSDLDAAKAVYTALLGSPHTTSRTTSGTTSTASRSVSTRPTKAGDRWPSPMSRISTQPARPCLRPCATERDAPRQVAPQVRICVLADADSNPIGLRGK